MKWFVVDITEACVVGGKYHKLCRQFQQAFIAAGAPADMALFAQTILFNDTRKVYFSPGSSEYVRTLIEEYGAAPCERPERTGLTLVFGVPDAGIRLLQPDVASEEVEEEIRPVLFPVSEPVGLHNEAIAVSS